MKTINFSPQAKVISRRCLWKKRIALLVWLTMAIVLIILFWYEIIDFQQRCQVPGISGQQEVRVNQRDESLKRGKSGEKVSGFVVGPEDLEKEEYTPVMGEGDRREEGSQEEEERRVEGYYLKVFSSVIKRDMEKVADFLASMDFSPQVIEEQGLAVMYNVYIDPNTIQDAGQMLERLKEGGFFVYRQENKKNQYLFRVASCYYPKSAEFVLENLKSKGFFGNIVQEKTEVKLYSILLGQYSDLNMVFERQKKLMLKGFSVPEVVPVPLSIESRAPVQSAPEG